MCISLGSSIGDGEKDESVVESGCGDAGDADPSKAGYYGLVALSGKVEVRVSSFEALTVSVGVNNWHGYFW